MVSKQVSTGSTHLIAMRRYKLFFMQRPLQPGHLKMGVVRQPNRVGCCYCSPQLWTAGWGGAVAAQSRLNSMRMSGVLVNAGIGWRACGVQSHNSPGIVHLWHSGRLLCPCARCGSCRLPLPRPRREQTSATGTKRAPLWQPDTQ